MPRERVKKVRRRRRTIQYNKIVRDFHIPEEYREKIINELKNGASPYAIAVKYGVMVSSVRRLADELVARGELTYLVRSSRFVYYISPEKLRSRFLLSVKISSMILATELYFVGYVPFGALIYNKNERRYIEPLYVPAVAEFGANSEKIGRKFRLREDLAAFRRIFALESDRVLVERIVILLDYFTKYGIEPDDNPRIKYVVALPYRKNVSASFITQSGRFEVKLNYRHAQRLGTTAAIYASGIIGVPDLNELFRNVRDDELGHRRYKELDAEVGRISASIPALMLDDYYVEEYVRGLRARLVHAARAFLKERLDYGEFLDTFLDGFFRVRGSSISNSVYSSVAGFDKASEKTLYLSSRLSLKDKKLFFELAKRHGLIIDLRKVDGIPESVKSAFKTLKKGHLAAKNGNKIVPAEEARDKDYLFAYIGEALEPLVRFREIEPRRISEEKLLGIKLILRREAVLAGRAKKEELSEFLSGRFLLDPITRRAFGPSVLAESSDHRLPRVKLGKKSEVLEAVERGEIVYYDPKDFISFVKGNIYDDLFERSLRAVLESRGYEVLYSESMRPEKSIGGESFKEVDVEVLARKGEKYKFYFVEIKFKTFLSPREAAQYFLGRHNQAAKILRDRISRYLDNAGKLAVVYAFVDLHPRLPAYASSYEYDVKRVLELANARKYEILKKLKEAVGRTFSRVELEGVEFRYLRTKDLLEGLKELDELEGVECEDVLSCVLAYKLVERDFDEGLRRDRYL